MFTESTEIIDVDAHDEGCRDAIEIESIHESIQRSSESSESIQWFPAAEAKYQTRLDQSGFTRAIKELTDIHRVPLASLRRGNARNTEYSQSAIDLIKYLGSGDREAFGELKQSLVCPPSSADSNSGAIVLRSIDERAAIARQNSAAADANLAAIGQQLAALMDKYRLLGEVAGEQAGTQFKQGFTSGVARSIGEVSEV